jgi:hypothetical protein
MGVGECTLRCSAAYFDVFLRHQLQLKVHAMTQSKLKWTMLSNLKEKIHIGVMTRQWEEDGVNTYRSHDEAMGGGWSKYI